MLTSARTSVTLPIVDLERAKAFYKDTLGLKLVEEKADGFVSFESGSGSRLVLFLRAATKADHTVASFEVQNIELVVRALEAKGVKFLDYEEDELKTVNHIATTGIIKGAWFNDTEGNILGLFQKIG